MGMPEGRSARSKRTTPVRTISLAAATVALLTTAGLPPAVAAPTGELPQVSVSTVQIPASPALSDKDIDAAKGDAEATKALVERIEEQLRAASGELESARYETMQSQNNYSTALLIQQDRTSELEDARGKAKKAGEYFEAVQDQVGQLAGELYRNGGVNPGLSSLLASADADEVLYKASTLDALSDNRFQTLTSAQQAAQLWAAWELHVSEAEEAAQDAAAAAKAAESNAKAASAAHEQLVSKQEEQRQVLLDHLAELRGTSVAEENQRISALEEAEQQRQFEALVAASERQAAAQPAAGATNQPASGNNGSPAGASAMVVPAADGITPAPASPAPATPSTPSAPSAPVAPPAPPAAAPAPAPDRAPQPAPEPERAPAPAPAPPPAPAPAPKPSPKPAPPKQEPAPAPAPNYSMAQTAINYATAKASNKKSYYEWAGNGPWGFDCSGLTQQAFGTAGKWIPRTAAAQYDQAPHKVSLGNLQPGDLVFWGTEGNFWHVALYIGGGQVVHAMNPNDGLRVTPIGYMYGKLHGYGARWT
ncbi:C40 family peptidase [Crystallibacter degradans]|uniref:C40 family peptidase n=1 Tax=Crystallibacter degradans TaxID=2726743 RepID=UPI0014733B04|nr:C40 family peptidase [Arthrobacter sp. SF27]NMR28972.1 glycoside hydrolase [Arthrobacter sp. SF27]